MTTASTSSPGVKSAMRTLDLIEYVVAHPSGVATREIATALGAPVSSTSYLLATLVERDYLRRDGRWYFAGKGLDRLRRPQAEYSLAERAQPLIRALRIQLNETSSLFVQSGWQLEALLTETSAHTLRYALEGGARVPLHCVAAGKAILASLSDEELDHYFAETTLERFTRYTICDRQALLDELARVRDEGIAFTREEHTLGIMGVGAAVLSGGRPIAAIGVASPVPRFTGEMRERIVEQVLKSVQALSDEA